MSEEKKIIDIDSCKHAIFVASSFVSVFFHLNVSWTFLLGYSSKSTSHTQYAIHITHTMNTDTLNRNRTIHGNCSLLSQIMCRIIEKCFAKQRHYNVCGPVGLSDVDDAAAALFQIWK